jgi:hypothetical protein
MSPSVPSATARADAARLARRIADLDWGRIAAALDADGYARIPGLLEPAECGALAALYPRDELFRKLVSLEQHRFGRGEYKYFRRPLPPLVAHLRRQLYPPLARLANRWQQALSLEERFPATHAAFLRRCRAQGQSRPTPLLLHYEQDDYNCLHQDLYGAVAFPLQLTCLLSRRDADFRGGEFLLLEQRPRMQSRGEAVALEQGEAILFPTRERPVRGARGCYRAQLRHGVSRVLSGRRTTLGIIFHDAK